MRGNAVTGVVKLRDHLTLFHRVAFFERNGGKPATLFKGGADGPHIDAPVNFERTFFGLKNTGVHRNGCRRETHNHRCGSKDYLCHVWPRKLFPSDLL